MGHAHEKLAPPFADIHVEGGVVKVTLLHDPAVEDVEMALYVDGSGSMIDEYRYRDDPQVDDHDHAPPTTRAETAGADEPEPVKKPGLLARLFGWFRGEEDEHHEGDEDGEEHEGEHRDDAGPREQTNTVEPQVRRMLQYLASKDRNGKLRVAYWACGEGGKQIEPLGELSSRDVPGLRVAGPKEFGTGTRLAPAVRDFVQYFEAQAKRGAKKGCGVFVTDGTIGDQGEVHQLSLQLAARIAKGELPPFHLVLVGVGSQVNEAQLEEIAHVEAPGADHLWCHRVAVEMHQMAELVSGLVDDTMTVASGGAVYDAKGKLVRRYERRLPAVLEFTLPAGHDRFTLEVEGQRYTQEIPDDDH